MSVTIHRLCKTEVIRRRSPWRDIDDMEYATLNGLTGLINGDYSSLLVL